MIYRQQRGLFTLDQLPLEEPGFLKDLSDNLPDWIHINSLDSLGLSWMSNQMQNDLQAGIEQVREQGPSFLFEIIHPNTTRQVTPVMFALRKQGDEHQVTGFIQMIRHNKREPYQAYYTTAKISQKLNSIISQTVPLSGFEKQLQALSFLMECDKIRTDHFIRFQSLTKREREILGLIAAGNSNKTIADRLCISYWTVRTHRRNILNKLDTNRIQDLLKIAHTFGL